jgi:hypothetical protein
MTKRLALIVIATAAAATMLATGVALASSGTASKKTSVVPIVMADPGCHWFQAANGKKTLRLTVHKATAFRNLDEAALVFKGAKFNRRVAVGKTLAITRRGVYRITMVGQHPDDNTLVLVYK